MRVWLCAAEVGAYMHGCVCAAEVGGMAGIVACLRELWVALVEEPPKAKHELTLAPV